FGGLADTGQVSGNDENKESKKDSKRKLFGVRKLDSGPKAESAVKRAPLSHSSLVSQFVSHSLNALSESVEDDLQKLTSGAGLDSPKFWDQVAPINVDKAHKLLKVLTSAISDTGLDTFLVDMCLMCPGG
ncbi:hypothetical protein Pmar_PMAR023252, partial [Perkinsus marinus ATCC 50983]